MKKGLVSFPALHFRRKGGAVYINVPGMNLVKKMIGHLPTKVQIEFRDAEDVLVLWFNSAVNKVIGNCNLTQAPGMDKYAAQISCKKDIAVFGHRIPFDGHDIVVAPLQFDDKGEFSMNDPLPSESRFIVRLSDAAPANEPNVSLNPDIFQTDAEVVGI